MKPLLRLIISFLLFSFAAAGQPFNNEWIDYSKAYYKFKVFGFGTDAANAPISKGMVRIPFATLQSAGLENTNPAHFQLWRDGKEVPVFVSSSGTFTGSDYIEFWGEINNGKLDAQLYSSADYQLADKWSLQTDTASYFLTVNSAYANKRLVVAANNVATTSLAPADYFMHTVGRYFRSGDIANGFYASFGDKQLLSSSYDRGEGWLSRVIRPVACGSSTTLPQNFPDLNPYLAGPAITIRASAVGTHQNSRVAKISLNGTEVAFFQMDYLNHEKVTETVPVNLISAGSANFTVENLSNTPCDEMRLAMIELTYPRRFDLGGTSLFELSMPASAQGHFLVFENFNYGSVAPVLYDISNGKRYEADITDSGLVKLVLQPSALPYQLVLTTQAGAYYKLITAVQSRSFINYNLVGNQGDYLIISNPLIYGQGSDNFVEQYRQYRSSATGGNYNAKIVDVEQLTDQFAFGVKKHPLSIKNFLKYARQRFAITPKHAFLIGKGISYNYYRKHESNSIIDQLNLVPTWGYPASDNLLASDDFKAAPATSIGRLSAVTPQEVGDYLQKVKQYDSVRSSTSYKPADKLWMKNVLHIAGANDVDAGNKIDGYMEALKTIITDTSFGAQVTGYSKTADPAGFTDAIVSFKETYENGASLITYFGHSSSTSLDFNLDDPGNYNNLHKYPVFIANGCSAGNHFEFEANRFNNKSTISEKFVLEPNKGAIGYWSGTHYGVPLYLDLFTNQVYKAIARTKYGSTAGEIIGEAIKQSLLLKPATDFYNRVHAETYAWHGDPAISFNNYALPDYAVDSLEMMVSPSFVSVADTGLALGIEIFNLGKSTADSVKLLVERTVSGGMVTIIADTLLAAPANVDSFRLYVPVSGNLDKGANHLMVSINPQHHVAESTFANNTASFTVHISGNEIRPVYPPNYAIISQQTTLLKASTADALEEARSYQVEIDTTALFNSTGKVSLSKTSLGGLVEFDPGFSFTPNQVYYWRVSPAGINPINWRQFSVTYIPGLEGAQQAHLYQHLSSTHEDIKLDSNNRKYTFLNQNHNLFITNAMYPISGTEDGHFSITVDGASTIRSACIGSSVIINVFDPLTFKPWLNSSNPFGAASTCNTGREYNFEYSYRTAASRKNAMDFIHSIPNGAIVSVRLINDAPYNVFASHWQADTSLYGSGKSLYHTLKQHGFTALDSFYFSRTWAFVFKKGSLDFEPAFTFSEGVYDKIILSKNVKTPHVDAMITSPKFGPAINWSRVQWSGSREEAGNDLPVVEVVGINRLDQQVVLYTLDSTKQDVDISSVSAGDYPFIQLRIKNTDSLTATPYQLSMWRVLFTPVREGAIVPNVYFNIPDTVGFNTPGQFNLPISVGFQNISSVGFDSLDVKISLTDTANNVTAFPINKLAPLAGGGVAQLNTILNVESFSGWYNLYVCFNPNEKQREQFISNNFLYKKVFVQTDISLPVNLLEFTAKPTGDDVELKWSATSKEISHYLIQHSVSGTSFTSIGKVNAPANDYTFLHKSVPAGKNFYRLHMVDHDGSSTFSDIRMVNKTVDVKLTISPNPVSSILTIQPENQQLTPHRLKIINMIGQQIWAGVLKGKLEIDVSKWPAGMYTLLLNEEASPKAFKINKL